MCVCLPGEDTIVVSTQRHSSSQRGGCYRNMWVVTQGVPQPKCFWTCKRCGYDIRGVILSQAYIHNYNLQRAVNFEVLPLSSYALSPKMLPATAGNIFGAPLMEQPSSHFFGCLQYREIFIPLRKSLFLETARSHSEPNQGTG